MVALKVELPFLCVNSHSGVVAHSLMRSAGCVEEAGLAAVGVAYEHGAYLFAFLAGDTVEYVLTSVSHHGLRSRVGGFPLHGLLLADHLNEVGLGSAQAHLIVHYFIFDRVMEWGVEFHFHALSLDESHLYDSFAETAVSHDSHDDTGLSCL